MPFVDIKYNVLKKIYKKYFVLKITLLYFTRKKEYA
jgi:hypothetical protein